MQRDIWNAIIKEHFNLTNTTTRKCLVSVNETDQNQILANLASKLYENIVDRVADIDYGEIPSSRGDITKIPNYMELTDCLNTVRELFVESKQSTYTVDTIITAIENTKKLTPMWQKAFQTECEFPVVFYNTICLSIVSATSLMISTSVELIKDPDTGTVELALARASKSNSKDGMLFKNLISYNNSCKKGDVEKTMEGLIKAGKTMKEGAYSEAVIFSVILGASVVIGLVSCIVPILHQLTSALYCLRQSISDYFAYESNIIRLNALKLEYDTTKTEAQKKKIAAKQNKIADTFKRWSDKLRVTSTKAMKDANTMVEKDNEKKYDVDEVEDDLPDSGSIF